MRPLHCDCGIELKTADIEADSKKPAKCVKCSGCDLALYVRGPSAVSHANPPCELFMKTCSHRLFEMHP